RLRSGLEGAGFQLLKYIFRERKFLADGLRQAIDRAWNLFFTGHIDFQRNRAVVLDVLQCGIDADLVSELGVLPPKHAVGFTEISHAADRRRVEHGGGGNAQVGEYLVQTIWAHCAQTCGLAHIRAQHIGEAGANPIQVRIARCIPERQNGQRDRRRGWRLGARAQQLPSQQETADRQHQDGYNPSNERPWQSLAPGFDASVELDCAGGSLVFPRVQVGKYGRGTLVSFVQIAFQALAHDPAQGPGDLSVNIRHWNCTLLGSFDEAGYSALGHKGRFARQQFVKDQTEGEDVRTLIELFA